MKFVFFFISFNQSNKIKDNSFKKTVLHNINETIVNVKFFQRINSIKKERIGKIWEKNLYAWRYPRYCTIKNQFILILYHIFKIHF